MLIDSELDHLVRGVVDIKFVYEMAEKARTKDDGTLVENPQFVGKKDPSDKYMNCLCGHDIVHNYIATCVQTGKSFIVGSDCIVTVCESKRWEYTKKCYICETNDSLKTKNYCKECSQAIKNFSKKMSTGKYKGITYYEIYEVDKSYVVWCGSSDYKPIVAFNDWVERVEEYPKLIEEFARGNEGEAERIKSEKEELEQERIREKERVYLIVPYEEKELAKSMRLRWDSGAKSWYSQRAYLTKEVVDRFPAKNEETQKRLRAQSELTEASLISYT
jgi:hypothetical protein